MCEVFLLDIENLNVGKDLSNVDALRLEYLLSISNEKRRKQSYFVWKLLEYALKKKGVENPSFFNNNGKWSLVDNKIRFSLSHSHNLVCVALDDDVVGVDIEIISDKLLPLEKRYGTSLYEGDKLLFLARLFTEEEAKFKSELNKNTKNYIVKDNMSNKYSLSVCTDSDIEIIKVENI